MFRLGLTGSIGSGKSTSANFFREQGIAVYDADAAVHKLYEGEGGQAGEASTALAVSFPEAIVDGKVNRKILSGLVMNNPEGFQLLERIIHPLVRQQEEKAIKDAQKAGSRLIVLDIPLLFETKAESRCDAILVVYVAEEAQKRRVLARPDMDEARFEAIKARQIPAAEKCRRAHFSLDTGAGLEAARGEIFALLKALAPRLVC